MKRFAALTCFLLLAGSLPAGVISLDRMDTFDTGMRLANGQQQIGSGTKMTYYNFWGNEASTDWQTWHWINDPSGNALATTGQVERKDVSSWSSTISGVGEFQTCYQGKAVSVASGETQQGGANTVCTGPNPNPRPCSGCSSDGTERAEYVGTPLVVNMGSGPWRLSGLDVPVLFDIDADGRADRMAWTPRNSALAFLALDLNRNGRIDDASELFGDHARLPNGLFATNGFEALKAYDRNEDGVIDSADALWYGLLLWIDRNRDGVSQPAELSSIDGSSLRGLRTEYHRTGRTDAYGNEFRYNGLVIKDRGQEPYYDIYFRVAR